jgi:hypothetical protein
VFSFRKHERIEGFHTKLNSVCEEIVGKCKKCKVKPRSKEVNYASRRGASPIRSELLGDNSNSSKEVLGKRQRQIVRIV